MNLSNLETIAPKLTEIFNTVIPLKKLPSGPYAVMKYPRWPALMHFYVNHFFGTGFGHVFSMYTRALGGIMQLATLVFTPNEGTDVPLLLIDVMAMKRKFAAFVEYYDCTKNGAPAEAMEEIAKKYSSLPDYPEKPDWYVKERTPYSLIKGGKDENLLCAMLKDSVQAYARTCGLRHEPRSENRAGLSLFIERMAKEGNPSSAVLTKMLGRTGAEKFFRTMIMPEQNNKND